MTLCKADVLDSYRVVDLTTSDLKAFLTRCTQDMTNKCTFIQNYLINLMKNLNYYRQRKFRHRHL